MKLVDLNPRWVGIHNWSSDAIFRIGLSFDSPKNPKQRLAVLFVPPIDPENLTEKYQFGQYFPDKKKWNRVGETFEELTLSQSLDFSAVGEWHGHITKGEVI